MPFQTTMMQGEAYILIKQNMPQFKAQAQNALASLQGGSVNSLFIVGMLNAFNSAVVTLTTWKSVAGLDAFATAQGYTGTFTVDVAAVIAAAEACIAWIFNNFPKAVTNEALAYTINSDGTITYRSFTSAQTSGLQTTLQSFIATIA